MIKPPESRAARARFSFKALASRSAIALALTVASTASFTSTAQGANPPSTTLSTTSAPVTWVGTAPGGASEGEITCVDGVNCDVFKITVTGTPEDWRTKLIGLTFTWTAPTQDYDFYIHKDSVTGPITSSGRNGGAPETDDNAAIDPEATGVGDYFVHVVYFTAVGVDQYRGTATIQDKGASQRTAAYVDGGGITFSPNVTVKAPVAGRDGEPSIRTDYRGNNYTGGIRGVPAGVDLWFHDLNPGSSTFDPFMRVPIYRGQPDGFTEKTEADVGGDGGGDIDLAVGFPPISSSDVERNPPFLAYSSLTLANIPTGRSRDRGITYEFNNAGNLSGGPPGDDRQWHEFLGSNSVYLLYRTVAPAIANIQRSDDGGFTYGATAAAGLIGQVGCLDVHQKTGVVYASGSNGVVAVGTPPSPGLPPTAANYTIRPAASDPNGVRHIFFVAKVADDGTPNGTLYVVYSNGKDIFLKSSKDKGGSFSNPVRVNPPTGIYAAGTNTNLFPWMETGPTPGSVGIVWYGTPGNNDDNALWKVYFAQSFNADAETPTFTVAEVTEPQHVIHGSNISTGGLTGTANRNLIDYFQISFDPQGAAVVAYTDDHNDFDGHTYVARQITGPSIKGGALPPQTEGQLVLPAGTSAVSAVDAFPPRQPGLNGEQITDFPLDAQEGQFVRVPTRSPIDITSVRYDTSGTGPSLAIGVSIRVSDLSTTPPNAFWRASFVSSAPNAVISADGTYSYGVSDDGDQAYLQADTNATGGTSFSWGRAVRNSDGTQTFTRLGAAIGEFNRATNTISMQVPVADLNAALASAERPLIGNGTVISGLRARSGTSGAAAIRDLTRGGTQFTVYDSAFARPAPTAAPTPLPPRAVAPGATPVPTPPNVELANIATRVSVKGGDEVGIAGFIVRTNQPKRVVVRGIGPSLRVGNSPLQGALQDPVLEVRNSAGTVIATSNNWRSAQQAELTASGLAPTDDREAAVILNLTGSGERNSFTAILRGADGSQGIGVVEVYDLDADSFADLGNISTRSLVGTGDDVLIGGFIVRDDSFTNQPQSVLMRGIGPSLSSSGITNPLQDPQITLVDLQGNVITTNTDWESSPEAAAMLATGIAPSHPKEAAILRSLTPGGYTVVLRGQDGGTGIGVIEAFNLGNQ